jgi:transcriptional regulator with XRE-family HTH domain
LGEFIFDPLSQGVDMMTKNPNQLSEADHDNVKPRALTKQEFGKRLYDALIRKGWNQSELARATELGRDSISTYIRGTAFPTPANLQKLASALGVERDALLPNSAQMEMDRGFPAMEIKMGHTDPSIAWLKINRMVSTSTAVKVLALIQDEDMKDKGREAAL